MDANHLADEQAAYNDQIMATPFDNMNGYVRDLLRHCENLG